MRAMKYCPFCGSSEIIYADEEIPEYAWCGDCRTWINAGQDFERHEIMYIVQKLKSIKAMMAALEKEAGKE